MASDCCKIITPVHSCRIVTNSDTMQYCAFGRTLRIRTSACAPPETGELPPEEGSWAWIAQIVRGGEAQSYWKVGDILPVQHAVYGEIDFQVAGFDLHTPVDSKKLNTMTLLAKTVVEKMMFDNKENTYGITSDEHFDSQALLNVFISGASTSTLFLKETDGVWYSGSGLYKLFINNNRWELWKCTVSHALTSVVDYSNSLTASPVGVEWHGGTSIVAGKKYYVLNGKQYIATEVTDGAPIVSNTYYEKLYDTYRPTRGYNSWKESAVRQWLNSDRIAGEWWSPQNIWDVAPPNAATLDGFLAGILDYGFIQALCPVVIPSLRNNVYSAGGIDYTTDLMFLPSRIEIFGSANEGGVQEGEQLTLYKGAGDAGRNKKDKTGADALWWTRSVQGNTAATTRVRTGKLTNAAPVDVLWLAPMCVIG